MFSAVATQIRKYPDLAFDALDTTALNDRDAAFAHALYDKTIRRWITLRQIVRSQLKHEWDDVHPAARAALLCGCAQLLFMDTVPAHAAVNESVNWADAAVGGRTGALVNAILRGVSRLLEIPEPPPEVDPDAPLGIEPEPALKPAPLSNRHVIQAWADRLDALPLSDGAALQLADEIWPKDPMERLAIATSLPLPLLRSWAKHMPMHEVRRLAMHCLVEPPVILNTTHAQSPLPNTLTPHEAPGHHVMTNPSGGALSALLQQRRDIWVQDPASSLAIESVVDLKPQLIIDACAGLGTKTRQLAATFPEARIIATDIDRVRHKGLVKTFKNHERVDVVPYPKLTDYAAQADLILLDAPCSNTGVLARRLEARYRWSEARADELISMQRQIVADAVRLLKPGKRSGGILYSTCSLDPNENEEIGAWARKWHGFDTAREHRRSPAALPGDPATRYTDGSYAILLV
ncbi:MAG: hypothetical protein KDA20_11770 [Phycisphaerales bacterium]|nr:hypothetical protein [Phycisphaerales bacterium]